MKSRSAIKYLLLLVPFAFALTACDVHEFPDVPESRPVRLTVIYHLDFTSFTEWNHRYDENNVYEIGFGDKYQSIHNQGIVRYIVRAYPKSENQRAMSDYVKEFVFTRDISEGYDCDFTLDLPSGSYTVMVWADFIQNSGDEYFYNADDFAEITLQGEHQGNNDYRDAYRGVADIFIPADIDEHEIIVLNVDMQRPFAKFEFVTTDLSEFVKSEQSRVEGMVNGSAKSKSDGNEGIETHINVEDYKIVFYYTGFMPNAYNAFTDKPIDSKTGVLFESSLSKLNDAEASMGFDYVFVNGTQSAVTVRIALYDNEGEEVSLSESVKVPLRRSYHTVMRGAFLTQKSASGVGINPDYNGDFNIEI